MAVGAGEGQESGGDAGYALPAPGFALTRLRFGRSMVKLSLPVVMAGFRQDHRPFGGTSFAKTGPQLTAKSQVGSSLRLPP